MLGGSEKKNSLFSC